MTSSAATQKKRNFIYRGIQYLFVRPFYYRLKEYFLVRKWAHHADERKFNWDWDATNFNRIAVVNLLVSKKANSAYLEIGCASNTLYNSVHALNKVGVDPSKGGSVRLTSDDFFKQNKSTFDVVFIDGMHTYEQVRKDVVNTIQCLNPGGWVAMHDMLPRDWMEHHVPIVTRGFWTGDVWKVGFELANTDGIDFKLLKIDNGVAVFRVTKENVVLKDMRAELNDKEFSYLYDNIGALPLIDWQDAQGWLRS